MKKNTPIAFFAILLGYFYGWGIRIEKMKVNNINIRIDRDHLIIWVIFWVVDYLFSLAISIGGGREIVITQYIFNAIISTVYFYICVFVIIIPYSSKSILFLILLLGSLITGFCFIKMGIENVFRTNFYITQIEKNGRFLAYFSYEVWRFSTMTFYAYAYWYYLKSIQEEKQRRHTEEKLLKAEIDFLKAQINPHFVFNTLNFVYNDVTKTNPTSGDAILSLTKLMRYSVESTKSEHSTVAKELEAIGEYIHLQRIRFGESLALNYTQSGSLLFFSLPPLVLLSIIENAFKYGIHDDYSDPIVIDIKVSSQGLGFLCRNKKRMDFQDKETTAVGNKNIKRRLEVAYPDNSVFKTQDSETHFEVLLDIKWKV